MKNIDDQDNKFPHSALSQMNPSTMFVKKGSKEEENKLAEKDSNDIIRVFIALCQSNSSKGG